MNKSEADVLLQLADNPDSSQRLLAAKTGCSLGLVNRSLKKLQNEQYLTHDKHLSEKAQDLLAQNKPKNAVILAAGYGMRMVPINTEVPKAMLEVHGEPLIERQIRQLQEAGITDITVIVGFMKEKFEYLIDEFGVKLMVNMDYADKNNLISLSKVADQIGNTYIVPCDLWIKDNPFAAHELYSWYMVSDKSDPSSIVRVSRSNDLVRASGKEAGNHMIGISYIANDIAGSFVERLKEMAGLPRYEHAFWEEVLFPAKVPISCRLVGEDEVCEINTYEQLRELDHNSNHLNPPVIRSIAEALQVNEDEIINITVLKKGMTNRSFLFEVKGERYIMRIPGEGTDQLINRAHEGAVYKAIHDLHLSDDVLLFDQQHGYKITRYVEGTHNCDHENWEEVAACMDVLRDFHHSGVQVDHDFDLLGQIEFYESLMKHQSMYKDYASVKESVMNLKPFLDSLEKERALTHVDAVCDNFLIDPEKKIRLIDWEYAGMFDPHLDVAMNCIYAGYDRAQVDRLIDLYFQGNADEQTRLKIYSYIACAGLLWSNWCEYKAALGLEFGEYALNQYRYAKVYSRLVHQALERRNNPSD